MDILKYLIGKALAIIAVALAAMAILQVSGYALLASLKIDAVIIRILVTAFAFTLFTGGWFWGLPKLVAKFCQK